MPATNDYVVAYTNRDMGEVLVLMVKEAMWLAAAVKASSIVIIDLGDPSLQLPPHYSLFCFSVSLGETREAVVLFLEMDVCTPVSGMCFSGVTPILGICRFAVGQPCFSAGPGSEPTVTW